MGKRKRRVCKTDFRMEVEKVEDIQALVDLPLDKHTTGKGRARKLAKHQSKSKVRRGRRKTREQVKAKSGQGKGSSTKHSKKKSSKERKADVSPYVRKKAAATAFGLSDERGKSGEYVTHSPKNSPVEEPASPLQEVMNGEGTFLIKIQPSPSPSPDVILDGEETFLVQIDNPDATGRRVPETPRLSHMHKDRFANIRPSKESALRTRHDTSYRYRLARSTKNVSYSYRERDLDRGRYSPLPIRSRRRPSPPFSRRSQERRSNRAPRLARDHRYAVPSYSHLQSSWRGSYVTRRRRRSNSPRRTNQSRRMRASFSPEFSGRQSRWPQQRHHYAEHDAGRSRSKPGRDSYRSWREQFPLAREPKRRGRRRSTSGEREKSNPSDRSRSRSRIRKNYSPTLDPNYVHKRSSYKAREAEETSTTSRSRSTQSLSTRREDHEKGGTEDEARRQTPPPVQASAEKDGRSRSRSKSRLRNTRHRSQDREDDGSQSSKGSESSSLSEEEEQAGDSQTPERKRRSNRVWSRQQQRLSNRRRSRSLDVNRCSTEARSEFRERQKSRSLSRKPSRVSHEASRSRSRSRGERVPKFNASALLAHDQLYADIPNTLTSGYNAGANADDRYTPKLNQGEPALKGVPRPVSEENA